MKKVRSLVALFVILATVLSLCPFAVTVGAEEVLSETVEDNGLPVVEITEDDVLLIEKLEAFGMISNEYAPETYLTRRQMANIIARYMLMGNGSAAAQSPFRDVSVEDSDFAVINALYDMGIVKGDDQFNFNPDNYVSYRDALVFVINAVGHKVFAERDGGYPTGYLRTAIKYGMLDNLKMQSDTAPISVIDVYKLLDAASLSATIETTYYGDDSIKYTLSDTENFLSTMYGIKKFRGQITGNENTYLTSADSKLTSEQISIGDEKKIYDTPGYVYGYFLGYTVDYYVKKTASEYTDLMYIEETPGANILTRVNSEDIVTSKSSHTQICFTNESDKEKYLDLKNNISVIYNNQNYKGFFQSDFVSKVLPANGYIDLLDNNCDGVYDVIFVFDYENIVVEAVDAYKERIFYSDISGTNYTLDVDSSYHKVNIELANDNKKILLSNVLPGDVISVAKSKGTKKVISVYVSREEVSGQVTGYASDLGYEINGSYYEKAPEYDTYNAQAMSVGLMGKFLLDINGKIVVYTYDSEADAGMLAVMTGIHSKNSVFSSEIRVRLFTEEEKFVEANLSELVRVNGISYDMTDASARNTVIGLIANDTATDTYVDSAYVVKYSLDANGSVKSLELERAGLGQGKLSLEADRYTSMIVRPSGSKFIISATKWESVLNTSTGEYEGKQTSDPSIFTSSDKNALVFYAPEDGDLENFEAYGLHRYSTHEEYHNTVIRSDLTASYIKQLTSLSCYSYNNTDISVADVMLLRGFEPGADSTRQVGPRVYTSSTDALNSDEIECKKLYQGSDEIGILAPSVDFEKAGVKTLAQTPAQIVALLNVGDTIRCDLNNDREIVKVIVYASYDGTTLSPQFARNSSGVIPHQSSSESPATKKEVNYRLGTLESVDSISSLIQVKVRNVAVTDETASNAYNVYLLSTESASVNIYDSERKKMISAKLNELRGSDQVIVKISTYYTVTDIIAFR